LQNTYALGENELRKELSDIKFETLNKHNDFIPNIIKEKVFKKENENSILHLQDYSLSKIVIMKYTRM